MGNATYSSIASALATLFQDRIVAQFNRACVLMQLLPYEPTVGKNVSWDVWTGSALSDASLGDGTDVTTYNDDTLTAASLNLASYSEAFAVTHMAADAAAHTGNPAELMRLYEHKLMGAVTRLAKYINGEIYSGAGATNHILGLTDATAGGLIATGTYAGIDRGVVTSFAGNELANNGNARPLDVDLMRDTRRQIYTACGEAPDLIVCDAFQWEQYGKSFGQHRRWVESFNTADGRKVVLDAGFKALEFDGIPVIMDVDCPAGKMLFLNTKYIKVRQLPFAAAAPNDPMAIATVKLHGTAEEQYGEMQSGMEVAIQELSRTGTARKFQLYCRPQLQVERPNSCAILEDLATS